MNKLLNRSTRKWLYAVCIALFALLGAADVMNPEIIPYWASFVAIVFGIAVPGVAAAHLPPKDDNGNAE